jgi:maltooligosyltrehalose trehalohydrolase
VVRDSSARAAGPEDRRLPVGAELLARGGTHFRVWAPKRARVAVVLEDGANASFELEPEGGGYFSGTVAGASAGALYRFRLDDEERLFPDPASRDQPSGPHGPSRVVDPFAHRWGDADWRGAPADPVIYELHVGTFTQEGTWSAAVERLPHLAELGVNVLEVMPVADFPGDFGWGYDGVLLFAPYHGYGPPDAFRSFVDAAHRRGLAVILDVVYNHLGPDGNYLGAFSDHYESSRHTTEWGAALNFDGPHSGPVRELCAANVRYWTQEFHVDGFRFDATQDLKDESPEHVLALLARECRSAAGSRRVLLVAENEPQDTRIVRRPEEGGHGLDMMLNDDFHHSAVTALIGFREAYYSQHFGTAQELLSATRHGFLYQGQWYPWQGQRRGTPTRGLPRGAMVHFLENHDQVANTALGRRLHELAAPGAWRALTTLVLLGPQTPYLFQGQEMRSSAPFFYFADQPPELAKLTWEGRLAFLEQFRNLSAPGVLAEIARPDDPDTFRRCKLDWCRQDELALALHRDLIRMRLGSRPFSAPELQLEGAVLGDRALVLRAFGAPLDGADDRLLLVNLGADVDLTTVPEPLLAPPSRDGWTLLFSTESPRYGGRGTPPVTDEAWNLPGGSALVMAPAARQKSRSAGDAHR